MNEGIAEPQPHPGDRSARRLLCDEPTGALDDLSRIIDIGLRPVRLPEGGLAISNELARIAEGDAVVVHPSDRVTDGVAVAQRRTR